MNMSKSIFEPSNLLEAGGLLIDTISRTSLSTLHESIFSTLDSSIGLTGEKYVGLKLGASGRNSCAEGSSVIVVKVGAAAAAAGAAAAEYAGVEAAAANLGVNDV